MKSVRLVIVALLGFALVGGLLQSCEKSQNHRGIVEPLAAKAVESDPEVKRLTQHAESVSEVDSNRILRETSTVAQPKATGAFRETTVVAPDGEAVESASELQVGLSPELELHRSSQSMADGGTLPVPTVQAAGAGVRSEAFRVSESKSVGLAPTEQGESARLKSSHADSFQPTGVQPVSVQGPRTGSEARSLELARKYEASRLRGGMEEDGAVVAGTSRRSKAGGGVGSSDARRFAALPRPADVDRTEPLVAGPQRRRRGEPAPVGPPDELLIMERKPGQQSADAWRGWQEKALARAPRSGELRCTTPGIAGPTLFPLKHTDVAADISVYVASVTVTQKYHNPYSKKIEAVYVFPLPQDAAVRDFVMTIGERRIRGIIREREEAQRIYREARRQGYHASLLTQERPNIFTQSVANIEPGAGIDVEISYFHSLPYRAGEYEFVFPMVVGPRYNPPGFQDGVGAVAQGARGASGQAIEIESLRPTELSAHDLSLAVSLDAGTELGEITSPTHAIVVERAGESTASIRLKTGAVIPNKDFVLRYRVPDDAVNIAMAHHESEGAGYFTLALHPPASLSEIPAPPREMVFVLDCSGSMRGHPIAKAKAVLRGCLGRLRPSDTFQVIRFSQNASAFGPAPIPATRKNVARALRYVEGLSGGGGTQMIEGVKAALDFPHEDGRFRIVAFLTDGYIGNDREIIAEVRRRLGQSRLFSFGIGSSVNRFLLDRMAKAGRGAVAYALPGEDGVASVDAFFRRVEHPAMTDVRVDWGALDVSEVYPAVVPDLFAGQPVRLVARASGGLRSTTVRVRGRVGGRRVELSVPVRVEDAQDHHALPALWARGKIAGLYGQLAFADYPTEVAGEIRNVALKYSLMSDFTAFVAVDSLARTQGDHGISVKVPVPVPEGVRYDTTVSAR